METNFDDEKFVLHITLPLSVISSCSKYKDFFLTKENALTSCGGDYLILEKDNE